MGSVSLYMEHDHRPHLNSFNFTVAENPTKEYRRVIFHNSNKKPLIQDHTSFQKFFEKYLGMDMKLRFSGDIELPLYAGQITEMYNHPQRIVALLASPTGRLWRTALTFNPSTSKANIWKYTNVLAWYHATAET